MFVDRDTITTALEVDYNLSSQVSGFIIYTEALVFEIFARLIFLFLDFRPLSHFCPLLQFKL